MTLAIPVEELGGDRQMAGASATRRSTAAYTDRAGLGIGDRLAGVAVPLASFNGRVEQVVRLIHCQAGLTAFAEAVASLAGARQTPAPHRSRSQSRASRTASRGPVG